MSLTQGFPSTFSTTQTTIDVLHNLDNETKKIYNDVNTIMAADGHAHTGNGSDGAKINATGIANIPSGNISATNIQTAINELDTGKVNISTTSATPTASKIPIADSDGKLNVGWQKGLLVAEIIVNGSPATSITFTGLDGNVHGGYVLVSEILNTAASISSYYLYVNGDAINGNYINQQFYISGSALVGASSSTPYLSAGLPIGKQSFGNANIDINLNGNYIFQSHELQTGGSIIYNYGYKKETITNLTSLAITATTSNSIGINSRFRLYRRL